MVVNILLSLALFKPLAHTGLALAISLAAFVNAGMLFRGLRGEAVYRPGSGWPLFLLRIALATAVMTVVLGWGAGDLGSWIDAGLWQRIGRLALWVGAGIGLYFLILIVSGLNLKAMIAGKPNTP
jgi:putative peptidoglycan lipid II flippase